jgi:membrane-associated phospholipid phosphatase
MAQRSKPRIDLRPGPFLRVAASRLDLRSRRGFPVTVALVVSLVSFLGFLSIVEAVVEPVRLAMDTTATALAVLVRNPVLTKFFWVATLMGDGRVMTVETLVAGVLLAIWGHPRRAVSVAALVLVGAGVATVLKDVIARPRPNGGLLLGSQASSSFPSGHALAGVLLFGTLALMLSASLAPKWVRVWGALGTALVALLIGLSRVYLGVHFFSDVLASWLLGMTMLAAWAAAVLVWGRNRPPLAERPVHPWGRLRWRWAIAAAGVAAVVIAIVAEMPVSPLR